MKPSEKPTPDIAPPQHVTVVACPLDLWSEVIEVLQMQPFKDVGRIMMKLGQLKPQDVPVGPSK